MDNGAGLDKDSVLLKFPRRSTWVVCLLAVATLTIYSFYWLYSRTKILNTLIPEKQRISMALCWLVIGLFVVNYSFGFISGYMQLQIELISPTLITNLVATAALLIWVFQFRNRLNTLVGASQTHRFYAKSAMTFVFQIYYLSYKVNENIDRLSVQSK